MINFKKLKGPHGIPVYHQSLPDMVHSVSMSWTMFVGGADDESVGLPGLYHWFEHVPFRGTKKYPGGYKDIKGLCTRNGGFINASTNPHATTYLATVPKNIWKEALWRITDMMSHPLLTDEGIASEREIIVQEITERKAKSWGRAYYELPNILWPGHPFGHHVLGTEETLRSMNSTVLRNAHKANYDRSRCIFTIAGNLDADEITSELEKVGADLPNNGLSARQAPFEFGPLPAWNRGGVTTRETQFSSSVVMMLFPLPMFTDRLRDHFRWDILGEMFQFGSLDSPLFRILRDERKLVYHTTVLDYFLPTGGYWGFAAEAQEKNIDDIIKAFGDVLKDPQVYSPERVSEVKTGIRGYFDIRPIDSNAYRQTMINRLIGAGQPFSDAEYLEELDKITPESIKEMIDSINLSDAHTIIFKGTGK